MALTSHVTMRTGAEGLFSKTGSQSKAFGLACTLRWQRHLRNGQPPGLQIGGDRLGEAPNRAKLRSASRSWTEAATFSSTGAEAAIIGVVIVDHGSRRAESNEMLVEFAALYRQITGRDIVEVAHMEIAEPTIEQAMRNCVHRGASKVIVAPYFLSRGRHIQEDIPALVAAARQHLPAAVDCVIADPIGIDGLMAQLIENRVRAAESRS